jgi:hypothetical protein
MNMVANEAYLGVADALSREGSLEGRHLPTPPYQCFNVPTG